MGHGRTRAARSRTLTCRNQTNGTNSWAWSRCSSPCPEERRQIECLGVCRVPLGDGVGLEIGTDRPAEELAIRRADDWKWGADGEHDTQGGASGVRGGPADPGGGSGDGAVEEDANPVTKAFMEQLFWVLRDDLATLRQELATTVKELKGEVTELGQRVDTVERTCERQEEDLDHHRQEIITLQDSNLQFRLENLENRSRRSNILIRGVPAQAIVGPLEGFVFHLFKHVAPVLDDQDIILDRTHRTGRPSLSPSQPQDILTCLHYYKQKEQILTVVRD
ncbi:hypothetical protein NDU88_004064 [Pleurodeles waltl]|uniref:Uncharacterized protein n=1 Tax=Pleurodeles waltl TaxID=8319 RepID=A0AAV7LH16_PLEWA|nr:hypothetical protein NDU88_004064 [Pleurodeles waltl]